VEATIAAFGSVDILVNNAGIQHVAAVDAFPDDTWDQLIAINLSSVFHTTKAALPSMKAQGWGRIVNIASAHGLVASPFKAPYTASKHAVVGFSKAVALEVAEQGITCNALCPGYVRTPLVEKQVVDQAKVHNLPEDRVIREVILAPHQAFHRGGRSGGLRGLPVLRGGQVGHRLGAADRRGWTAR
jgi:3-hydroxybutyrate dehydrogenase